MRTVAEEHKARQLMDELHWDLPLREIRVAGLALRQSRKACPIRALCVLVAQGAFLLQRRVLLVIERPVLRPQTQGKKNATKESEYVSLYLLPFSSLVKQQSRIRSSRSSGHLGQKK